MLIIIAAGGTGGHVFPALAVAAELVSRRHKCLWIGRPNSLEERTALAAGIDFLPIKMQGVRGRRIDRQVVAIFQVLWGIAQLYIRIGSLTKSQTTRVVTFGGYTSVAAGVSARLLRLPLIIHEQNSYAGTTNRLLARWADLICCGLDGTFISHRKRVLTGNPIRHKLTPSYRQDHHPLRVLILGGSLGAASLNRAMVQSLLSIKYVPPIHLVHQCGPTTFTTTKQAYQKVVDDLPAIKLRLKPFLQRIDWYYSWCDLIVCRAGAITVSELCAAGKFAILVPFPHATDNHQLHNAEILLASGGAVIAQDDDMLANKLAQHLKSIFSGPVLEQRTLLHQQGKLLVPHARVDATKHIVRLIEQLNLTSKSPTND